MAYLMCSAIHDRAGGDFFLESHTWERLVLSSSGQVTWVPNLIVRTTCTIDITYFPWDVQVGMAVWGCSI